MVPDILLLSPGDHPVLSVTSPWDNTEPPKVVILLLGPFNCSFSSTVSVFADVLVMESKVRPRVRQVIWDGLTGCVSMSTGAVGSVFDPSFVFEATGVLDLGLEVARGAKRPGMTPGSEKEILAKK